MPTNQPRVIDVHHHWIPQEIFDTMERWVPPDCRVVRPPTGWVQIFDERGLLLFSADPAYYADISQQIRHMDAAGIDLALLSASCFPSWMTLNAARVMNDAGADLQQRFGDRVRPMIHVPPFSEPGIEQEIERAAKLGLSGVCITTNFKGRYPDDAAYLPFLRTVADCDLTVFVHAAGAPVHVDDLLDYDLARTFGRSIDHTLVAIRLIYGGVLAGLPKLRMVMPHLGGSFFVNTKRFFETPPKIMHDYPVGHFEGLLDQLLFDTAPSFWYGPPEITCAVQTLGVKRLALGSDYPVGSDSAVMTRAVEHLEQVSLSQAERERIMGGNASDFFSL